MLRAFSHPIDIDIYQKIFDEQLSNTLPVTIDLTLGFQGGSFKPKIRTNGDLWYGRWRFGDPDTHRYWNGFGILSDPNPGNIIVEVNMCLQGLNRRISGVFAEDNSSKKKYILHRGGIGGGRTGIGKKAFLEWYRTNHPEGFAFVKETDGGQSQCILIGEFYPVLNYGALYEFVIRTREFKKFATTYFFMTPSSKDEGHWDW